MCEVPLGHQVVCLEYAVYVFTMNAYSYTHYHVLWAFGNTPINTEEVRTFERLEAKTADWGCSNSRLRLVEREAYKL